MVNATITTEQIGKDHSLTLKPIKEGGYVLRIQRPSGQELGLPVYDTMILTEKEADRLLTLMMNAVG
jgi:hypothetical protein